MSLGGNGLVIKEVNINLVRSTLKAKHEATKAEIAQITGLSVVTVTHALQELLESKEVLEGDMVASSGGRRALQYRFNENFAHVLVLFTNEAESRDVLHIRVANLYGECIDCSDELLTDITVETFEPYVKQALSRTPTIRAIGFGLPGFESGGKVVIQDYKKLVGTNFTGHYKRLTGLPVIYENDVNATLDGYCRKTGGNPQSTTVYMYFPVRFPPGAAVQINGNIYKGSSGYAGEISFMPYGIDWLDPALYQTFEPCCEGVSKMVISACCLLNPGLIILHGPFFTPAHLEAIRGKCAAILPGGVMPDIIIRENFLEDYQVGIIHETLALLDSHITIIK